MLSVSKYIVAVNAEFNFSAAENCFAGLRGFSFICRVEEQRVRNSTRALNSCEAEIPNRDAFKEWLKSWSKTCASASASLTYTDR
jgi:hypothetical protein